jgi:hypothetical protein
MRITIRPVSDCIELIRSEFEVDPFEMLKAMNLHNSPDLVRSTCKNPLIEFLKTLGLHEIDAKNWWKTHTVEINENDPPLVSFFGMECHLPEELFSKSEWVFKVAKEKFFESLVISGCVVCHKLSSIAGLKSLPKNISNLSISDFQGETLNGYFQKLKNLPSLKGISFYYCLKLKDISLLENLANLQALNLNLCRSLTDTSSLSKLLNLKSLNLENCESLVNINVLSKLLNLQSLKIWFCRSLININCLSGLLNLRELSLSNCESLTDISDLSGLANLRELSLSNCESLTDLSDLSGLANLRELSLNDCASLTNISDLSGLINLRELSLRGCKSLTALSDISGLVKLQTLKIEECISLTALSDISGLVKLQTLKIEECISLVDISDLSGLINLRELSLRGCESLSDISVLFRLENLQFLNIEECKRIQSFSSLRNCFALEELEESIMHPVEHAELLCFLAVKRKDIPYIRKNLNTWLKELDLALGQKHSIAMDLACSLARGIVLANLDEDSLLFHQTLLNHPNVGIAPWKIWFSENLNTFGRNKFQKLVQFKPSSELTFGAIGGISYCLPALKRDTERIIWAKSWILEIHSLHCNNPTSIKPAAVEWCLILKKLGEDELLELWVEKFTDPSDSSSLDSISNAFSAYFLNFKYRESALEYALKINDPKLRDESILNLAQQFIKDGEITQAGEYLFLLTQLESRTQLALSLAENSVYLKSDENAHRLLAACGDNPQSLASILDKLRLANPASEILKIMHEKLSDESRSEIPIETVVKECNSLAEFLIHTKDSSQLVRIQQAIESVIKSN